MPKPITKILIIKTLYAYIPSQLC